MLTVQQKVLFYLEGNNENGFVLDLVDSKDILI